MPAVSLNRLPMRARGVALSVKVFLLWDWLAPFSFRCRLSSLALFGLEPTFAVRNASIFRDCSV
jgi:hypothetical protein